MPLKSPYPNISIPQVDIWAFLFERKDRPYPDNHAMFVDADTKRAYTFSQLHNAAVAFGRGLKSVFSWRKGEVLAVFAANSIDMPAVIWGCHWAGGTITTANPAYTTDELLFQLRDCNAKAIVTQTQFLPIVVAAAKQVGISHDRIMLMGDDIDAEAGYKHFTSIRSVPGTFKYTRTQIDAERDIAFLVYSSGTTGHPKGVMLTHRNMVSVTVMFKFAEGNFGDGPYMRWNGGVDGKGDRLLACLPFFHIYGLMALIHCPCYAGIPVMVMSRFDFEKWLLHVQNWRIAYAYVVPPQVLLLGKHPAATKYDLSSLKMLNSGAAPLTVELVDAVYTRLGIPVKQAYGLSETSPTTHTQHWEEWDKHIGSIGKLLPNLTAKIVSESGQELPVGQTGELWVKGPNVFVGYLHNEQGTRSAKTADGFFKTGDVGYVDEAGNFYITDRIKELIKYKGFQVAPAELEGLLLSHPKVDDAAVVGVYSESHASELPTAYVVLAKGVAAGRETAEHIAHWLHAKVAHHKRLRGGIRFVEAIPKSASGKILRRFLKQRAHEEAKSFEPKPKL